MLTMHQEQVDAFQEAARQRFENKMVEELKKFFPKLSAKLGAQGLRDVIRHGTTTAREYGIVRQCDVGRYIAVTLMFGPNFDKKVSSGPLYETLRDARLGGPAERTNALCRAAVQALRSRTLRTGKKPNW